MTSADGTKFIIAYQYANDGDLNDITEAVTHDLTNKVTPASPVEHVGTTNDPTVRQQPLGNLGTDVDRDFLEGFLSGRECLPGGAGWWRYEICYGKHVIQFHVNIFLFEILIKQNSFIGRRSTSYIDFIRNMES